MHHAPPRRRHPRALHPASSASAPSYRSRAPASSPPPATSSTLASTFVRSAPASSPRLPPHLASYSQSPHSICSGKFRSAVSPLDLCPYLIHFLETSRLQFLSRIGDVTFFSSQIWGDQSGSSYTPPLSARVEPPPPPASRRRHRLRRAAAAARITPPSEDELLLRW